MSNKISVSVNVDYPRHLSDYIAANKKHLINELIVIGEFNCSIDGPFIQSMCNALDSSGNRTGGQLELLNLSSVNTNGFYTAFEDCITLRVIIFGMPLSIDANSFSGCTALECIVVLDYQCPYSTDKGVLYLSGYFDHDRKRKNFYNNGEYTLVKFPAAKREVKDIRFDQINKIADSAFEDFKGTDLYINNSVPPACTKDAFYNVDRTKVKIHVPKDAFNSYWSHSVWGEFQIVGDLENDE